MFTDYIWYALLGVGSGVVATLLPMVFYGLRDLFHKVPVPPHIKPAIGGFVWGCWHSFSPRCWGEVTVGFRRQSMAACR